MITFFKEHPKYIFGTICIVFLILRITYYWIEFQFIKKGEENGS